jgi:hypothetical protein
LRTERKSDQGQCDAPERITEPSRGNLDEALTAKHSSSDPLLAYLGEALRVNNSYEPPSFGRPYRTPMWEFVRRAKAHSDLERLDPIEALAAIERCIRSQESASADADVWEVLFPNSDDPREEFIYTWDRIKWPRHELDRAQSGATALPLKPHRQYSAGYERFISIAGHLQRGVNGPILLPCVKLSEMLRCKPMAVSRYRHWAQRDGLLKLTSRGIRAQRKADEFTFAVELFDWETGEQMLTRDTEIQENQEIERKKEIQEKQEKKETQEMQRETRAPLPEKRKCAIRQGPYIPTTVELAQELQRTAHLRSPENLKSLPEKVPYA